MDRTALCCYWLQVTSNHVRERNQNEKEEACHILEEGSVRVPVFVWQPVARAGK